VVVWRLTSVALRGRGRNGGTSSAQDVAIFSTEGSNFVSRSLYHPAADPGPRAGFPSVSRGISNRASGGSCRLRPAAARARQRGRQAGAAAPGSCRDPRRGLADGGGADREKDFRARLAEIAGAEARGKPIEVWFADEARVGQKNKITRRLAGRGTRPRAPHDQRTTRACIYGAICPAEAKGASAAVAPGAHAVAGPPARSGSGTPRRSTMQTPTRSAGDRDRLAVCLVAEARRRPASRRSSSP
jgi:hypothetical protein